MSGSPMGADFQAVWNPGPPEAMVMNEDTRSFEGEFFSYGEAELAVADQHDREERLGLPFTAYSIIPVKASPGGRDFR